jgi:protein-tyrosine phosphatase
MIDLHSHFLYGVDDGAKDSDATLQMLAQAEGLGISKLLATPHVNEMTTPIAAHQIKETFHSILQLIRKADIAVQVKLAGEVNFLANEIDLEEYDWVIIGIEHKYILTETPFLSLPERYAQILFNLRLNKITPVLAHPERNLKLQNDPTHLIEWIHQGCLVQLDAGSITGQFGKKCQRFAERLLDARAVHIVASDAHSARGRNYHALNDAYQEVESRVDNSYAQQLFEKNPASVWDGRKIKKTTIDESVLYTSGWEKLKDVLTR